jgi:2,4-dienoyl-CoA reductase-like NADH-dependent reductase (Old Yellow Enzyme family)
MKPETPKMPHKLFSPLTLRSVTLPNRIAVAPMCQYSSEDGFVNDWHLVHLGSRAVGGAGLVIMEASAVLPEGRITPSDVGIWKDEHIAPLQKITRFIEQQGAVAGIQLAHAGRKASDWRPWLGKKGNATAEFGGWQPVGPSPVAFSEDRLVPTELSTDGIKQIVQAFADAAVRAHKAGFKVIEIHGAHGYLVHQFLSPFSNKRTDNYGGSFENRTRLLLEITAATRKVWPADLPVFVRLSATEWTEGGFDIEDTVKLCRLLKELGVDLIDTSSAGNLATAQIPVAPGYQTALAERVRRDAGIPTGAVGLITDAAQAEHVLQTNQADLVLLARELLRDPYWPLHAAAQFREPAPWAPQYVRAAPDRNPMREDVSYAQKQ